MDGKIFKLIGYLAYIGLAALALLVVALPFAMWWAYHHIQVVVR